ncbi:hypothetical protein D3C83_273820 [compost metagenome]
MQRRQRQLGLARLVGGRGQRLRFFLIDLDIGMQLAISVLDAGEKRIGQIA